MHNLEPRTIIYIYRNKPTNYNIIRYDNKINSAEIKQKTYSVNYFLSQSLYKIQLDYIHIQTNSFDMQKVNN